MPSSDEDDPVRARMATLTVAELREVLGAGRAQWQPEALEAARAELARRDVDSHALARAVADRALQVSLAGARWLPITCDQCGGEYLCRAELVATGYSDQPLAVSGGDAPCPRCGCYQEAAIARLRAGRHEWLSMVGTLSLIVGGAAGVLALVLPTSGLPAIATLVWYAAAVGLIVVGGGALRLRRRLQARLAPNADAATRILREGTAESRALPRERYEELWRAEQLPLSTGVHAEAIARLRTARELLGQALAQSKFREAEQIAEAAAVAQLADAELRDACAALGAPPPPDDPLPTLPKTFRVSVGVLIAEEELARVRAWMQRRLDLVEKQLAAAAVPPARPYR